MQLLTGMENNNLTEKESRASFKICASTDSVTNSFLLEDLNPENTNINWKERYHSLVSTMTSLVWTTNPLGQMIQIQPSWTEFTGQKYSEYKDFGWMTSIHVNDRDRFAQSWARSLFSKKPFECDGRIWSQKHGYYRFFHGRATPLLDENHQIKEWVGTLADIHERKSAEIALKESERRFHFAVKNAPLLVASTDLNLRYTWVHNRNLIAAPGNFIGKTDEEIFDASSAAQLTDLKRQVLTTRKGARAVLSLRSKNINKRTEQIFDFTIEPLLSEKRSLLGLTVAALDITHVKFAEAAANQASSAKTQFLTNMSHEIRTPIGVILGYSELALETVKSNPVAENFLKSIQRNGEHLLRLIGEILDLSKIESDQMDFVLEPVNVVKLLNEVVDQFRDEVERKGLEVKIRSHNRRIRPILTDRSRLRQIFVNLISNSVKFTLEGKIIVELSGASDKNKNGTGQIQILIQDTGIGLTDEQRKNLFMPFTQGDNSMSRKFGGTGLGLMISRGIAQKLGGDLQLRWSEVGQGSLFELLLPNRSAAPSLGLEGDSPHKIPERLRQARVLVVEDSKDIQFIVTSYLKNIVDQIDIADDGAQALQLIQKNKYDLILLDIQMPGIDGYETLRLMHLQNVEAPVVALTAHALVTEKEKALKAGFHDYITKPVSRVGLINRLIDLFNC